MSPEAVMSLGQGAMKITLSLAAPPLLAALICGLIISLLQAATQINEQTLSFIPKVIAVTLTLLVAGPWMLSLLLDYIRELFSSIAFVVSTAG